MVKMKPRAVDLRSNHGGPQSPRETNARSNSGFGQRPLLTSPENAIKFGTSSLVGLFRCLSHPNQIACRLLTSHARLRESDRGALQCWPLFQLTFGLEMRILTPLLFVLLCLATCSTAHALQNTPIVVSAITPASSGDAELYYDPATGDLIVTTNGVAAVVITGQSDNTFDLSDVDPGGTGSYDVVNFETVLLLNAETYTDNQLAAFGFPLPTGVHNLGSGLAPGATTPAAFVAAFGDIRLDRIVQGQPRLDPSGVVRILVPDPVEVVVSQGENQRSMLREIDVTLPGDVQIGANAFSIVNRDDNSISPTVSFGTPELVNGSTTVTLTFSGSGVDPSGSLSDGNYLLTIDGDLIINAQGNAFDADEDGTPGGQLVIGNNDQLDENGNPVDDKLYRLFGDVANCDRAVDGADVGLIIPTLFLTEGSPSYNDSFDFNADGAVDGADIGAFIPNLFRILAF